MNRIEIVEKWRDATGQYCANILVDDKLAATVYSERIERMLLASLEDRHCEIWRSVGKRPAQFARRGQDAPISA